MKIPEITEREFEVLQKQWENNTSFAIAEVERFIKEQPLWIGNAERLSVKLSLPDGALIGILSGFYSCIKTVLEKEYNSMLLGGIESKN